MKFIFDITTLYRWHRPPVGVVRVELELAKYFLLNSENLACVFVRFSKDKTSLIKIDREDAIRKIGKIIKDGHVFGGYKYNSVGCFIKELLFRAKKISEYIGAEFFFRKPSGDLDKMFVIDVAMQKNDVFISVGLMWGYANFDLLNYIKTFGGVNIVVTIHDLIPLTHSQYCLREKIAFTKYFYNSCSFARLVFVSNFSRLEFQRVAIENNMGNLPVLKAIYLGSNVVDKEVKNKYYGRSRKWLDKRPYVLYVSTVEVRKNHIVLLNAWLEAQKLSIAMPNLICVGKPGWQVEDMLALYESNSFLKQKIFFLSQVDDVELGSLYRNCLFTVFPSHVEGWGLGASESLAYGKVCLISTAAALDEATQGLMPKIEGNDVSGWMNKISQLFIDTEARKELERKIKSEFVPRKWETFAKEFVSFAANDGKKFGL